MRKITEGIGRAIGAILLVAGGALTLAVVAEPARSYTVLRRSDVGGLLEARLLPPPPPTVDGLMLVPSPELEVAALPSNDPILAELTALADSHPELVASLGYEVVQSIFPGWKFAAVDTIAANALHGALLIGNRHEVAPRREDWLSELCSFTAELFCDGRPIQSGGGEIVLGSPLRALHHLVKLLADDPQSPSLGAGELVSTGTLTLAMSVRAGQTLSLIHISEPTRHTSHSRKPASA